MADRLAQHLVQRGLLPAERVEEAARRQTLSGGTLETALLEAGVISEAGVLQAVSDVAGHRLVNLADFEPNHEVASYIPPKIAERLGVVPLSMDGTTLHVACTYPVPAKELEEISFLLNKKLELWVALEVRVRDWISAIYHIPAPPRIAALLAALDPSRPLPLSPAADGLIEELTLEDELGAGIQQIAESVAHEPIPLENRKAPPRPATQPAFPAPSSPPARRQTATAFPAPAAAPSPSGVKSTSTDDWEHETALIDIHGYKAFARESARSPEPAQRTPTPLAFSPPQVAPYRAPFDRAPTQPEFPAVVLPGAVTQPNLANPAAQLRGNLPAPAAPKPAQKPAPPREPEPRFGYPDPPKPAPPPPAQKAPPPPAPAESVDPAPNWSLAEARNALKDALKERDQILDVALRYARHTFDFVAAFAVIRGSAVGWDARGEGADKQKTTQISIPLDAQSVFRTVALTRGSYVGPLPPDALTKHFLGLIGRAPRSALVFPVEVKARLVAILYGDSGQKPVSQRRLSDLILFCQDLPGAFQDLLLYRKQRFGVNAEASAEEAEPTPPPPPASSSSWSPLAALVLPGLGRAATMPATMIPQDERPPPDFEPVLRRLTGPDASGRARAMAELARSPEASARVLVKGFPGPTAWSRLPVVELPEAEELGPIPGALARLGRPGAQALAPLLDADDPDIRYFALLTAGNLPFVELVDGVLRGLFDLEPDISSAARAAATALRRLPRFDAAMRALRQELAAVDSLRRTLAARALGVLHDRESIDGLIGLTGSSDQMCAQAAAEALRDITKVTLGTQARSWSAWWAENRSKARAQWLVAALRSEDFDVRLSAIEELSKGLNNNLGYFADAPSLERETAIKRWEQALVGNDRLKRLDL